MQKVIKRKKIKKIRNSYIMRLVPELENLIREVQSKQSLKDG